MRSSGVHLIASLRNGIRKEATPGLEGNDRFDLGRKGKHKEI